jgi:hypothetical protein
MATVVYEETRGTAKRGLGLIEPPGALRVGVMKSHVRTAGSGMGCYRKQLRSNSAVLSDTTSSPLRAQVGAANRERSVARGKRGE